MLARMLPLRGDQYIMHMLNSDPQLCYEMFGMEPLLLSLYVMS